jgi:hypothetical protein
VPRVLALLCLILLCAAAATPIAGPPGWTGFTPGGTGTVAAFRWPEPDGSFRHTLGVTVTTTASTLDEFIDRNTKLLQGAEYYRVEANAKTQACGQPAWHLAYSHPGLTEATKDFTVFTEQIVTVRRGRLVIATYIHTSRDPPRADAENWIGRVCGLN